MKLNWGNYIFIFILLFLTLCTVFIIFSLRQNNDLVTDNYYNEGADYTTELAVINRSTIYNDSILPVQNSSNIVLKVSPGLSDQTTSLNIWFYRPSSRDKDLRSDYSITGDSVVIDRAMINRGRYILKISWNMDGEKYRIERDIFIN